MIHPTAIIHPNAKLHPSVQVGPYAVIDGNVELGEGCVVGPQVYLTGYTTIGAHNRFHAGAVIGDAPQDLKYKDEPTRLRIGDNNVFREHVTIHRSNKLAEDTIIGSNCLLMAGCHVGHNSNVGNHVIIANGSMLGGHVTVGDRAFLSGSGGAHQFVRIGTLSIMQGGAIATADLPPFCVCHQVNLLCGLNVVGLRRAGISSAERMELKQLYRLLFRSGLARKQALAETAGRFQSASAKVLIDFVAAPTKRGLCSDPGSKSDEAAAAE
jgi:UDP-N-acetylglucosamine acyltransferase